MPKQITIEKVKQRFEQILGYPCPKELSDKYAAMLAENPNEYLEDEDAEASH